MSLSLMFPITSVSLPAFGEKIPPKPFSYQYNVSDVQSKHEQQVRIFTLDILNSMILDN